MSIVARSAMPSSCAVRGAFKLGLRHTTKRMNPEILFVTGKGGVGKSTVAAALALKKAKAGLRVLLVEIGDQSFFKDYFQLPKVGFEPTKIDLEWSANLSVALWTGENCLREYIIYLIKVEALYKLFFENAVMKAFINVAPALPELAIMGKATSGPRHHGPKLPYDCLVIDCFATGHFMALMGAAAGMAEAVKFGPMGEQSRSIDEMLRNQEFCHYYLVSLPEELPVRETEELYEYLKRKFGIKADIILNKCLTEQIPPAQFQAASKSSSKEFRAFAEDYKVNFEIQTELRKRLESLDHKIECLPQVWSTKTKEILNALAEGLR
jgi:anion-transporting  ArsA/GET3 family ATPase